MTDNEIIQEATEAIEKNLNAGCYVEDLLRIVKEQQAEIERLTDEAYRYQTLWRQLQSENDILNLAINVLSVDEIKSEAYGEFAERLKWYVTVAESKPTTRLSYSSLGIVNMIDLVYNELTRNSHGTCMESNE